MSEKKNVFLKNILMFMVPALVLVILGVNMGIGNYVVGNRLEGTVLLMICLLPALALTLLFLKRVSGIGRVQSDFS